MRCGLYFTQQESYILSVAEFDYRHWGDWQFRGRVAALDPATAQRVPVPVGANSLGAAGAGTARALL